MNNKNIIKTSHELNHFRGGYTRLELDFIYAFISTIKDEDERFKDYKLSISELENKLGKRLEIKKIEYIFESLISKSFKINNNKELAVYSFFTYLHYNKETKELTVNFNERLKPHLIQLKTYAKGNFKYLLQFKSEYSKRIYMLLSQWKKAGSHKYKVDELREMLAVPKSYKYNDFKKRVIAKAEKEFKEKGDIYFTFKEKKEEGGKKVTHILFDIIIARGEDKEKPSLEEYKGKVIYYNGEDRTILNVWEIKEEKGYILVQLLDSTKNTMTDKVHISQLDKMIEYAENRPTLF
jgi:plasmid replication initiation protein